MRTREQPKAQRLLTALETYEEAVSNLPGIASPKRRATLIERLVESDRRNRYIRHLATARLGPRASDPTAPTFNPLTAAVANYRVGQLDEAFWLVFLFVHFGKHPQARWRYAREVYSKIGSSGLWTWEAVRQDLEGFRDWIDTYSATLDADTEPHGFGNHRKYESLQGWSDAGTGAVVATYVVWVGPGGSHLPHFDSAQRTASGDPEAAFDLLYESMRTVRRFGRLARFDYLSTVEKLGLAPIRPGRTYLRGSTGPLRGARLLFDASAAELSPTELDDRLTQLNEYLCVGFDVLEDALCNWQKHPDTFRPFRA